MPKKQNSSNPQNELQTTCHSFLGVFMHFRPNLPNACFGKKGDITENGLRIG